MLVAALLACAQPAPVDKPDVVDTPAHTDVADTDAPPACAPAGPTWTRDVDLAGGVVVIDEIAPDGWIELVNQMAIDVDIGGWQLRAATTQIFPSPTLLAGGARLVVPIAPSDTLELISNGGRRMDAVTWVGPAFPVVPAGQTLAKRRSDLASARAESWAVHPTGTPGEPGFLTPGTRIPLVAADAIWAWAPGVAPDDTWADPAFDDAGWDTANGPFGSSDLRARVTADNHFAVYLGGADGSGLRGIGRDTIGDWTTVEEFVLPARPGDHLWLAAWEGPGDAWSPQMLIAEVVDAGGPITGTSVASLDVVLGPTGANPGDLLTDPPPAPAVLQPFIAAADAAGEFAPPAVETDRFGGPWGGAVGGQFTTAAFVWHDTFDDNAATNQFETYALFRSRDPLPSNAVDLGGATTTWFRTWFDAPDLAGADASLLLVWEGSDGGVVYLNGVELDRQNLPAGRISAGTEATARGGRRSIVHVPTSALVPGPNLVAVEVHLAPRSDGPALSLTLDLRIDAVAADVPLAEASATVVIHELMVDAIEGGGDWIELYNATDAPIALDGWSLVDAAAFTFPAGTTLPPGGFAVVAADPQAFGEDHPGVAALGPLEGRLSDEGEQILLRDACGLVVDRVAYGTDGRWPERADGGGSSLELIDPRTDNTAPEAWAASDESSRAAWQTVHYTGVAAASAVGDDNAWQEFVFGLLAAGEVLVDDVSVVADPGGANRELVRGGDFEGGGLSTWRRIGTHGQSGVEVDPTDPSNQVMRVVATGPTEHQHNQVSVTLEAPVRDGTTYEISLRVRWVGGSSDLNTRLYFNRLAVTHRLPRPTAGGTPGRPNSRGVANAGPTWADLQVLPAVPSPDEPVTVRIAARDPDAVRAVTLNTSTGGAFTSTPMRADGAGFIAVLPGFPAGTLVQLYVAGDDTLGTRSTFPALGADSRALFRVDDPLPASPLHTVRILMRDDDNDAFHAPTAIMSNALTRVTVVYDEREVFWDVGVRAKGSQRGRPEQPRLGFALRFDPDHPLRGVLDGVSIDRSEGVISGQREILMDIVGARYGASSAEYNDLIRLIAPRSEHSGDALLQTARFSDLMLRNQFPNGDDGTVFEYELVYYPLTTEDGTATGAKLPLPDSVVGAPIAWLGADPENYRYTFLIKNNRGADDYGGVLDLCRLFSADEAAFAAGADSVIDLGQWLESFAIMTVAGAVDQYGDGSQHNAQIYVAPDGRSLLFPHDLDFFHGPHNALVGNGDLRRLLQLPGARRTYYAALQALVAGPASGAEMEHWRDHIGDLLPRQPFGSHHGFMVDRARWIATEAPDSIAATIPPVSFAVLTEDFGAPVGEVAIEGRGWLDVHQILVGGRPTPLTWTGDTRWRVVVPIVAGDNLLALQAVDRRGAVVGEGSVTVTGVP